MQRYFVPAENWQDEKVFIINDDVHHITRVMRLNLDDEIVCLHPDGRAARCIITEIEQANVSVKIVEWLTENNELPIHVTIVQALPKGDKLDWILQKGTELGANAFVLFQADRSIVKWDEKKLGKRIERFNKIVKEASEQCERNRIPTVNFVPSLEQVIASIPTETMKLVAYEAEAKTRNPATFYNALSQVQKGEHIMLCIGPEGGFTEREIDQLKKHQFQTVRLGKRILRTETAALYGLASISYHFEEISETFTNTNHN